MNHLVLTPFRCGSSYLTEYLRINTNYDFIFSEKINELSPKENLIVKCHRIYENNNKSEVTFDKVWDFKGHENMKKFLSDYDYVYTLIRKPTEIFISAYVRDFEGNHDIYPYQFKGEISTKNLDEIIEHFLSFDWSTFEWLSYDYNFESIKKITGLDIWNLKFDKNLGINPYKGYSNLVVSNHRTLFDKNNYHNFDFFFKKHFNFSKSIREYYLFSNKKDYPDLYDIFKKKIPKSFFEKYKKLDDKIVNKFL